MNAPAVPFRSPADRLAGVSKIAVLRANALGDLVFALPAYEALKAAYPGAELVLLASPWHAHFLGGRLGPVDRVEVIPVAAGLRVEPGRSEDARELQTFFARMRGERFDLAVQLHGGGRQSNPFVLRLEARTTIGRRTPDAAALDRWLPYFHYQHEVLRALETVSLAGAVPAGLEPALRTMPSDHAALAAAGGAPPVPFAVLHPSATDPRRRWKAERFAAVAAALQADGCHIALAGQAHERVLLEAIAARLPRPCTVVADIDQGALAALLSLAAVAIGNDSGPTHLARALGTLTVQIFWGPNLVTAGPFHRERDRVAISWQTACPQCGCELGHPWPYTGYDCGHRASLLDPVPVEEVLEAARSLLAPTSACPGRAQEAA